MREGAKRNGPCISKGENDFGLKFRTVLFSFVNINMTVHELG